MSILSLRHHPDPVLRRKAQPVRQIDPTVRRLVADMVDTMNHNSGVGLAAPQVGVSLRVAVIEVPEEPVIVLINPEVVKRRGWRQVEEGCLSYPGYRGEITRSEKIVIKALNLEGETIRVKAEGLAAQALEHELDHLNGVLYIDHLEDQNKLFPLETETPQQAD
jgi:peptide deformylase